MKSVWVTWVLILTVGMFSGCASAQDGPGVAGVSGGDDLVIAAGGQVKAVIVVSPQAGKHEKQAAADLAKYIGLMCGQAPTIAQTDAAVKQAMAGDAPAIVVGQLALKAQPRLERRIASVLKKNPQLRIDGIGLLRQGNRVYVAGNNDVSHYFAAAELLKRWGCRWYIPTEIGDCIPDSPDLRVGALDYLYSSPFELRGYWISWVGDYTGKNEFQMRNMMIADRGGMPSTGHALAKYTNDAPGSKSAFNFPITAPETARHVAKKIEEPFAAGQNISVGMEDGSYDSDYPKDKELMALQWDKYFLRTSVTDPMLELYNNVAKILQDKYPNSNAKLGFLAYANMTIPPVREMTAERSLYCELAPIDIDPIHGMDDPQSPPRQEYRDFLHGWAKVMNGRVSIYDYDQGMLVWRDLPNPSHMAFRQDVKHYRDAGILGVNTESRNAIATTFLNLFMRAQLLWDPDVDVDALLDEFYPKFYGPAAEPMKIYWSTIYDAWENTICTEHEHFIAPAVYTPEVLAVMTEQIKKAQKIIDRLERRGNLTRNEQLYVDRMRFTRYSYDITAGYLAMVNAAATECDYAKAVKIGEVALAIREELTDMNGTFTTYRGYKVENNGYAWWPGEVRQYRELLPYTNGTKGRLITKLPIDWAMHRDDDGTGLQRGFATDPVDLSYWNANRPSLTLDNRKDYPDEWEVIRTDLYAQAQGVRNPDRQSYTGHLWYRTNVTMDPDDVGSVHVRFPGMFNEAWLYVNGKEVAHRPQQAMWWHNDYRFEWDVDLSGKLQAGGNTLALRFKNPHHFGGMFRRPFLYEPIGE